MEENEDLSSISDPLSEDNIPFASDSYHNNGEEEELDIDLHPYAHVEKKNEVGYEDIEDESSEEESETEYNRFAYVKDFPIQLICLEKCDGTFDELFMKKIIDEKENELIKNLDTKIKKTNPEFPNNEKSVDFLTTIMEISTLYDAIVGATKKKIEEEGYLTIDQANGLINGLVEYVKKFLDVDLTAAYSVVDEAEGNVLELTDDELQEIDEAWGLNEAPYVEMPSSTNKEPEEDL
jgi:hypothetical protein